MPSYEEKLQALLAHGLTREFFTDQALLIAQEGTLSAATHVMVFDGDFAGSSENGAARQKMSEGPYYRHYRCQILRLHMHSPRGRRLPCASHCKWRTPTRRPRKKHQMPDDENPFC